MIVDINRLDIFTRNTTEKKNVTLIFYFVRFSSNSTLITLRTKEIIFIYNLCPQNKNPIRENNNSNNKRKDYNNLYLTKINVTFTIISFR